MLFRTKKVETFHDAEIDIERLDIVSIEREGDMTVFGIMEEDVIVEWQMRTSPERHDIFVGRYRAKLTRKAATPTQP